MRTEHVHNVHMDMFIYLLSLCLFVIIILIVILVIIIHLLAGATVPKSTCGPLQGPIAAKKLEMMVNSLDPRDAMIRVGRFSHWLATASASSLPSSIPEESDQRLLKL